MRDIIWTVILIWLVYKIVGLFRLNTSKQSSGQNQAASGNTSHQNPSRNEQDIKKAVKKHLNKEGEYIDFEEIK